ncbi:MAG: sigma-70 family RNA polymerase sigma factor [Actinobacteria bacterium]|nr:MAG: sigma-70 family RNA polymerase sigma factor [Actinomycetota bacterium]
MPSLNFETAYDEHLWRVFGFFAYRVGPSEAEDLTQQTFERALRAWRRFDDQRSPVGAWLLAIARNLLIDHYRASASRQGNVPIDEAPAGALLAYTDPAPPGPEPAIAAALDKLSDRDRELIALRYGGDLTTPEIAALTGLALANVQQILSRAQRRLRSELEANPTAMSSVACQPSGPTPASPSAATASSSAPDKP